MVWMDRVAVADITLTRSLYENNFEETDCQGCYLDRQ